MLRFLKQEGKGEKPNVEEIFMSLAWKESLSSLCYYHLEGSLAVYGDQIISAHSYGAPRGIKDCKGRRRCYSDKNGFPCIGISPIEKVLNDIEVKYEKGLVIYSTHFPSDVSVKKIIDKGVFEKFVFGSNGKDNGYEDWILRLLQEGSIDCYMLPMSLERRQEVIGIISKKGFD